MSLGLYPPMAKSPVTYLAEPINESATTIIVDDISKLPDPPNIATIGDREDSETIRYGGKTGNSLTSVTRGFEGDAKEWSAGTPIANVPCAQHIRALQAHMIPKGCILMWGGLISDIPSGWALCDGANGTPDLRDRFILGVSASEDPGETGGSHTKTLSTSNLPSHTHSFTTGKESQTHNHAVTGGNHTHTYQRYSGDGSVASIWGTFSSKLTSYNTGGTGSHSHTVGNASKTHTHSGTTASTGSGTAIDIRPKYYKLAFIMKL